jgi:hypothetical protein
MVEPIPPYLIALAVGDYVARELSPRSRIWAAAALADGAARAFGGVEELMLAAERLLGPYRWQRFDLLLAPPSFPHGGMENPGLAFLSPSLLDDESARTAVLAHELAHAWSGNLVTAASAEHFWLNEAFTVWAERRILAEVAGSGVAQLHADIGRRELDRVLPAFAAHPELTRLRLSLDGVDPDEALSLVPYEKGYLQLRALESTLGEAAFIALARAYFDRFAGQSITSEDFVAFARPYAPSFPFEDWLNQSGLPGDVAPPAPAPRAPLDLDEARGWSGLRWRAWLQSVARPAQSLPDWFNQFIPRRGDARAEWLALAIGSDWRIPPEALAEALTIGRLKELRPIYAALAQRPARRGEAAQLYRRLRTGYHPIARQQLERLLRDLGVATEEVKPLGLGRRT